jgi:hypothetical protein
MLSSDFITASRGGNAYIWATEPLSIDVTDTALLVRNDHQTKNLHIEKIAIHSFVETEIEIHVPTAAFTPTGTAVVGECLNRDDDNTALATAKADETANTQGDVIERIRVKSDTDYTVDFGGALILGYSQSVAVDTTEASTELQVSIWAFFK